MVSIPRERLQRGTTPGEHERFVREAHLPSCEDIQLPPVLVSQSVFTSEVDAVCENEVPVEDAQVHQVLHGTAPVLLPDSLDFTARLGEVRSHVDTQPVGLLFCCCKQVGRTAIERVREEVRPNAVGASPLNRLRELDRAVEFRLPSLFVLGDRSAIIAVGARVELVCDVPAKAEALARGRSRAAPTALSPS